MKLILLLFLSIINFSYGEKLERTYLPPNALSSDGSDGILEGPKSRPIVVLDDDQQRQIDETVLHEEEIQRPHIIEVQRPIVTNVVTDSPALQRPVGFTVSQNQFNANSQVVNDVVRIGNRGNFFVQNQNSVDYKDVNYPGPRYQVVEQRQERTQSSFERNAKILRQEYKNEGDAYAYAYETENGIYAEENGVATNGVNAEGAYSYIGDDGVQYSMSYSADENGFQPKGDHIPTPHPIPEEILRSLEQNARDEAAGIFDDGSYDPQKYGEEGAGNQQRISIVTSRPYTPSFIQSSSTVSTIINQGARNEDVVSIPNPLLQKYRLPGYRYTNIQLNQRNNNLSPVADALIQEVSPSTVKSYLPPVKRKVPSENKPSKFIRKNVVVIKKRKPEPKKNDKKNDNES